MTTSIDFPLRGELLAVDLVNTRVRRHGVDVDLLDRPAALTAWLHAERERLAWNGAANAADLAAVRRLRDAIVVLLHAARAHLVPPADALAVVNRAARRGAQPRLRWPTAGPRLVTPTRVSRRGSLLQALAADAITLLVGPDAERLRECAHPDCVLQFVARNPRRRWCVAAVCGNRARVARHYERQHEAG